MIAVTDKQAEARIRYVWLNRKTNHVEPKDRLAVPSR
jgi:cytochrome c